MIVERKEDLLQNDELHIKLRKHEKTLAISGFMVLMFGVWDVIRLVLEFTLNTSSAMGRVEDTGLISYILDLQAKFNLHELGMTILIIVTLLLAGITVIMNLAIRIIIWRAAVREARGGRPDSTYIFLSVVTVISNTVSIFVTSSKFGNYNNIDLTGTDDEIFEAVYNYVIALPEMTITLILSITSVVLFLELIMSALYVKKYRKKMAEYSKIINSSNEADEMIREQALEKSEDTKIKDITEEEEQQD